MQNFILGMGLNLSDDEKEKVILTAYRMLDLTIKAQNKGILPLEYECLDDDSTLFKLGIQLMVNGVDPNFMEKTLQYFILSNGYTGIELLENLLIAEGILCIAQGRHYSMVVYIMGSILGERGLNTIIEYARQSGNERLYSLFPAIETPQD